MIYGFLYPGFYLRVYSFDEMQDRRSVFVAGEVRQPGEYSMTGDMTLTDLISLARGITELADTERIEIARFPDPENSFSFTTM